MNEAQFTAKQRKALADKGQAMPDGSYPTPTLADLTRAIQAWGRAPEDKRAALKRYLSKRAKELDAPEETLERIQGLQEAEPSLDAQSEHVRMAWRSSYPTRFPGEPESWVSEVYEDRVIVCMGEDYFEIPYTHEGDEIGFDTSSAKKVERTWVPVEMQEAEGSLVSLRENDEPEGSEWEVVVIKAGTSRNGRIYSEALLRRSVGLFEGARVLARSDEAHVSGAEKSVEKIVGWLSGVRFESGAVRATLHVSEAAAWLRTMLADAWRRGKRDLVGLSIVAEGKGAWRLDAGKRLFEVEEITKVSSVDVVFDPAAGGELTRLVAAMGKEEGGMDELKELTVEELEKARPDLVTQIKESAPPAPTKGGQEEASVTEAEKAAAKAAAEAAAEAAAKNAAGTEAEPEKVPAALSETVVEVRLAKTSLPEVVQAKIRKGFVGQSFEEHALTEAIQAEVETWAELEKHNLVRSSGSSKGGTEVGLEEADRAFAAYVGFFLREDVKVGDERIPRYRSIREAYEDLTGDRDCRGVLDSIPRGAGKLMEADGRTRYRKLAEAEDGTMSFAEAITTTQFNVATQDAMHIAMVRDYVRLNLRIWEPLVDAVPARDFRTKHNVRVGGYGNLPAVAQSGSYDALTSPTDEEITYAVSKRGGTETVTIEAIANDATGHVRGIPQRLARAAAQTLHEFVLDFIATNPNIYDGTALFVAGHGSNLLSAALSVTSLNSARQVMRSQTELDSSKALGLVPKYLWVPNELERLAYELTVSDQKPGTADNDVNFVRSWGLAFAVVDYWTDANNWFVTSSKDQVPLIELAFFGPEEPELFVQDLPNVGSIFTNDRITYKIRHVYGGAVQDFRGFVGAVVA